MNMMVMSDFRLEVEIWSVTHAQLKICNITITYGWIAKIATPFSCGLGSGADAMFHGTYFSFSFFLMVHLETNYHMIYCTTRHQICNSDVKMTANSLDGYASGLSVWGAMLERY